MQPAVPWKVQEIYRECEEFLGWQFGTRDECTYKAPSDKICVMQEVMSQSHEQCGSAGWRPIESLLGTRNIKDGSFEVGQQKEA